MRGIKTGIGVGEAQVIDSSGIANAFIKAYQLKQKEDQLFAEKIADNLSKFDTTGLTGKDLEKATALYDELRGKYENISKLNRNQKTLLDAQVKKEMNGIKGFVANAKQFYKDKQDFLIEYNKDKYSFIDEVEPQAKLLSTLSYSEALDKNLGDVNTLRMKRTPDMRLIDDSLNDFGKIVKGLSDDSPPTTFTQDNIVSEYRTANPKSVDAAALAILTDNAKKFAWTDTFKRQNPDAPTPSDIDLVAFIKKSYENKNGGAVNSYRFLTGSRAAQKSGEGKQPTEQEQYSGTLNGAFGKNPNTRAQAIAMIKSHSKGKISDLVENSDGTLTLIPFVENKYSGKMKIGDPITITSAGQLNSQLGSLGITQSGFGVIPKLNQGPASGSQTSTPSSGKTMIMYVTPDGTEYNIPADKVSSFLKQFPKAKRK